METEGTKTTPTIDRDLYSVTPARASDLEEISELVNSAYRGESSRQGWTTEADFLGGQRTDPRTLAHDLSSEGTRTILCLREKNQAKILGCVYLSRFVDIDGVGCYLGMLTINPALQAGGMGRFLLEAAENQAKEWGATRMLLGVIQLRDTLMAWYERRGYQRTGKTEKFPYGDSSAGIPAREDLHFIFFEKQFA